MEKHRELSDTDFLQQFANCQLPPAFFSHEAHLRFAWLHLEQYEPEEAIRRVANQIISYVTALGAGDKFNRTLTVAAVRVVHHFRQRSLSHQFLEFLEEFPQLKNNFKGLLASHYAVDIYQSDLAKKTYLEPDLLPFS
jgi:hypothetical protein